MPCGGEEGRGGVSERLWRQRPVAGGRGRVADGTGARCRAMRGGNRGGRAGPTGTGGQWVAWAGRLGPSPKAQWCFLIIQQNSKGFELI
jgi:hypothetical protein